MPVRVQLKRSKGWRMPENTLKVDRTTRWGNPFTLEISRTREQSIADYSAWLVGKRAAPGDEKAPTRAEVRQHLGGKNLACWCPLDGPCHAGVLLAMANEHGD
ncbi:MAG: DUF4326 domain-containing protein [Gammaproteobacteria bacterium]|nr:DUF4326 domain-containing protein [Gammaproteobacteria bacterium]